MIYDVTVIGGGPAGLTAAIYAKRANKSVLVIEKATFGGQITFSPKVENIPGFTELSGNEFAEKLVDQVLYQGADTEFAEVTKVERENGRFVVSTDGGSFTSRSVVIATGAKHRTLGLSGEEKFIGGGISFCAVCDGAFYAGKTVAVIGGGNSALQEALLLADTVKKLYVVQNLDFFTGEAKLVDQLLKKQNVEVMLGTVVDAYVGDDELKGVVLKKTDGTTSELALDGVFLAVGLIPQNEIFSGLIKLDGRGYAEANENCLTETEGIFVAGDCRTKKIRQVTTACSDGAVAALAACDYVDSLDR